MFTFRKNKTAHSSKYLFVCAVLFLLLTPLSLNFDNSSLRLVPNVGYAIVDEIIGGVGYAFLGFGASIAGLGGRLFDASFMYTVVDIGTQLGPNGGLRLAVDNAWTLVRDICNLAFIFGFIYTGFKMIFDPSSADAKRFFVSMITGALLINFSLYFVKAIVDISNSISVQIYNEITTGGSMSASLFTLLGIPSIYNIDGNALRQISDAPISFYLLGMIFMLIVGFVFFTVSILLITRFVGLILIMIGSPLLFAAQLFPHTKSIADDLWKKLINYAFFVPTYLIAIFISITIINGLGLTTSSFADEILQSGEAASSGNLTTILNFSIAIFFIWSSISIAEKAGIMGGKTATSMASSIRGFGQGLAARGAIRAGFDAVRAVKTGADMSLKRNGTRDLKESWKNNKGISMSGLAGVQDDWRNSNSKWKQAAAGTMRGTGLEAGIQAVHGAKFGSTESIADVDKTDKKIGQARAENAKTEKDIQTIKNGVLSSASNEDKIAMERTIAGMNEKKLTSVLKEFKKDSPEYAAIMANLTSAQFDAVMKKEGDDAMSLKDKDTFKEARQKHLEITYGVIPGDPGKIHKMSGSELEQISPALIEEHAAKLTTKQIDDMKNFTRTQKDKFKQKRKDAFAAKYHATKADPATGIAATPGTIYTALQSDLEEMDTDLLKDNAAYLGHKQIESLKSDKDKKDIQEKKKSQIQYEVTNGNIIGVLNRFKDNHVDLAMLPKEVLTRTEAAPYITPRVLTQALNNPDLTSADKIAIKTNILSYYHPGAPAVTSPSAILGAPDTIVTPEVPPGAGGNASEYADFTKWFRGSSGLNYK